MATLFRPRTLVLFAGDILFFTVSLWVSLYLRVFEIPNTTLFEQHLAPFSLLFVAWVAVYFIAGLYESRSIILARRALSGTLLVAQSINMMIAALFFFFVPLFGIAPKTLLVIYLVVSFMLVLLWRVVLFPRLGVGRQECAIVVGNSPESRALVDALNRAPRAPTRVVDTVVPLAGQVGVDTAAHVRDALLQRGAKVVIADFNDSAVAGAFPELSQLLSQGVRFFDAASLYEEVFGRIALSAIDDNWIARNVSRYAHVLYDSLKRVMDIVVALLAGVVSLIFYPFLILAIKLQDNGPIFYRQVRTGKNNRPFVMYKFRSMTGTDQGTEVLKSKHVVTPVGRFIRKTRIDEIPQLWNVLKGDLSLIGPRPEFPALVDDYAKQIPYYNVRHLVKPGLSGWAQLYHDNHPHHGTDVEATREKFSYDLYYLKHRSLMLDTTIVLKTIKKLLIRSGV